MLLKIHFIANSEQMMFRFCTEGDKRNGEQAQKKSKNGLFFSK